MTSLFCSFWSSFLLFHPHWFTTSSLLLLQYCKVHFNLIASEPRTYKTVYTGNFPTYTNVSVSETKVPSDQTARTLSLRSKITISASFPRCSEPFRSSTPIKRAGVSDAIRIASSSGISAFEPSYEPIHPS